MRDLKADMETCKNATPGPWMASIDHEVEDYRVCQDNGDGECICCLAMMGNWDQETQEWTGESKTSFAADTRFIAAAREGWPHAIERAIAAEAEVERLKKALEVVCADLACDDACPDHEGADWPECQNCPGRHGEIHQDTGRDIRCWMKYYQGQALAELED